MAPLIFDLPTSRLRDAKEHELDGQSAPLAAVNTMDDRSDGDDDSMPF
jgi:hypothetical protein